MKTLILLSLLSTGCMAHAHPRAEASVITPSHTTVKVWVNGRYIRSHGHLRWRPGYWAHRPALYRPGPQHAWIPGHYNSRGKWVPGHWRG